MKKRLMFMIPSFCFIAIVAWGTAEFLRPSTEDRAPASVSRATHSKEQILKRKAAGKYFRTHGKGNGLFNIAIEAPGKGQVTAGTVVNLEATIAARADLADLRFNWVLPQSGVSVVSGPTEGTIGSLLNGDTSVVRLSISNDTNENHRIHLHVYRVVNGENMGQMVQYNTVDQEMIEATARTKAEMLQMHAELTGTEASRKIHH